MNINLVYEGKNYNFDIPNGVTIDYLKELSSKIFNSEKELLDLIYNNEKVENNDNNILIRDLIPEGETNAVLTVQLNKNLKNDKNNNKQIVPLVNLKQKDIVNTINEDDEILSKDNDMIKTKHKKKNDKKKNLEKEIKFNENQSEKIKNNYKSNDRYKTNLNNNNNYYANISKNSKLIFKGSENHNFNNLIEKEINKQIFFENTYIKKNNELINLIKEFNEKIKKIHIILYKKLKNSGSTNKNSSNNNISPLNNNSKTINIKLNINNNYFYELSLYEKKILNFLEKQILFYKNLLEMMKNYDDNLNINNLNEFYSKLMIFNIIDNNKKVNIEQLKSIKFKGPPNKKLINNSSSDLQALINNKPKKLPFIQNIYSPIEKDKNRNISRNNRLYSGLSSKSIRFASLNENKENKKIKNAKGNNENKSVNKIKNFNLDENNISNNLKHLSTNNVVSNNLNNKNILSEKNLEEKLSEKKFTFHINRNHNFPNSFKNAINNISPIKIARKGSISNFIRKSIYLNDKDIIIEENNANQCKNMIEDYKSKKDKRIKEINISNMTINDSNFAREKNISSRRNRKISLNKYDFFV